jgi:antirestriction protein ArdC
VDQAGHRGAAARGLWPEGQDQRMINFNRVSAIDGNSRLVELRHRSSDSEVNTVFNVAQCDGLPEKIIKGSFEDPPKHQGEKACYIPSVDEIHMPSFTKFTSADGYYATLFHECNHWSGAGTRLNRTVKNSFGTVDYALEELVAELGSAFLCAEHNIDGMLQSASYIESWIKNLKDDPTAFAKAAAAAQRSVNFLHGQTAVEVKEAA